MRVYERQGRAKVESDLTPPVVCLYPLTSPKRFTIPRVHRRSLSALFCGVLHDLPWALAFQPEDQNQVHALVNRSDAEAHTLNTEIQYQLEISHLRLIMQSKEEVSSLAAF